LSSKKQISRLVLLEVQNLGRVVRDALVRLPALRHFQQQRGISIAIEEGQIEVFNDIFSLMDHDGGHEIRLEQFVEFGQRVGGECAKVFTRKMFRHMHRIAETLGVKSSNGLSRDVFLHILFPNVDVGKIHQIVFPRTQSGRCFSPRAAATNAPLAEKAPSMRREMLTVGDVMELSVPPPIDALHRLKVKREPQSWQEGWSKEDVSMVETMFSLVDEDGDGLVSAADIYAFIAKKQERPPCDDEATAALELFQSQVSLHDADGDGKVTAREFAAMQQPLFEQRRRSEGSQIPLLFQHIKAGW
jgi:Ca2+-binding EF-hand superfamily protein